MHSFSDPSHCWSVLIGTSTTLVVLALLLSGPVEALRSSSSCWVSRDGRSLAKTNANHPTRALNRGIGTHRCFDKANSSSFAREQRWLSAGSSTARFPSSLKAHSPKNGVLVGRLTDFLEEQQREKNDGGEGDINQSSVLPIFDVLESVRDSLASKPNLLLQAAPGAGKTTIVPLQLLLDLLRHEDAEHDNNNSSIGNQPQQILVVAPRRVAVRSAAQRISALIGEGSPGGTVGYAMRDETRLGPSTRIKVVTDGVLLNLLREDPELSGIGIVVLDEFHERGSGSDTSLALLREVQQNFREDDLKIVVMSATLLGNADGECDRDHDEDEDTGGFVSTGTKLIRTLGGTSGCGIIESEGRQYPIQLQWANQVVKTMSASNRGGGGRNGIPPLATLLRDRKGLIQAASNVVERAALKQAPGRGDVLVFLPGVAECKGVVRELSSRTTVANSADVFALYGAMPKDEQDEVLYPKNQPREGSGNPRQRVIVSTPIAEASLTIPGVTCVVDSGLRREPRCDADTGMSRLVSARISKASAIQRAGRAGRLQEGSCLRMYTETDFESDFAEQSLPELASTDLAPILLLLADWGVSTLSEILHEMPFVDPPEKESLQRAERFLVEIGALEKKKEDHRFLLTGLGRKISKMPCHPRLATCISAAMSSRDESLLAASIAAAFCLDDESSSQGGGRRNGNGDDPNLAYAIESVVQTRFKFSALLRFANRVAGTTGTRTVRALETNHDDFARKTIANLGKAMLPGFIDLVAERKGDASYESSNYFLALGKSCRLGFRNSPPYVLAVETNTGPDGISRIRSYVSLSKELLEEVAVDNELLYTVPSKGYQVRAKQVRSVGRIELSSAPLPSPSPDLVSKALLEAMKDDLGGIGKALLKFVPPKDQSRVDEMVARIRLDKELTQETVDWPPCFEALDAPNSLDIDSDSKTHNEILTDLVEPWLGSVKSLKELKTLDILLSTLSLERKKYLDDLYPTFIEAPDGSRVPVRYESVRGGSPDDSEGRQAISYRPVATAKLQQFFGARETPVVGPSHDGVALTLSLVSPAGKPLAETGDLPFFWKEVYPSIRSEMRGRYPKHPWPENPLEAVATRKTKKQLSNEDAAEVTADSKKKGRGKGKRNRKKR